MDTFTKIVNKCGDDGAINTLASLTMTGTVRVTVVRQLTDDRVGDKFIG